MEAFLQYDGARLLLGDERPNVCVLLTGTAADPEICRSGIQLSGSEHDIALILVRGHVHASTAARAGINPRVLRHELDMEKRARARALCEDAGLGGRCTFAVVDRVSPKGCTEIVASLHCHVLVLPSRSARFRRRAFSRAARHRNIGLLVV